MQITKTPSWVHKWSKLVATDVKFFQIMCRFNGMEDKDKREDKRFEESNEKDWKTEGLR